MGPVWAVVVAAGSGSRFGGGKQYEKLRGVRLIDWAVAAVTPATDGVVVVVPPDRAHEREAVDATVAGGSTRSASVRAGLAAVPADAEIVVVHDAARPLASAALCQRVIDAIRAGADAAVPGVPVVDTLKRVSDTRVVETVDRTGLVAVQTPQAFRSAVLRAAHDGDPDATDDAALVERVGGSVVVVPGEPRNLKVTEPDDVRVLEALA